MKRVRIEKPKVRQERWWLEVLPIDPRDRDVLRAKSHADDVHPRSTRDGGPSPASSRQVMGRSSQDRSDSTERAGMTDPKELHSIARSIIDSNRYMTLATADASGTPWASPVWYAPGKDRAFLWVSSPEARHSRNLAIRPQLAVVIYDSHRPGGWHAVYMSAIGEELASGDLDEGIAIFSRRSLAQGMRAWTREDVVPPARHRLYRATASELFVLDPHDERLPVSLES